MTKLRQEESAIVSSGAYCSAVFWACLGKAVLKRYGFSRAAGDAKNEALAPEGRT